MENNEKYCLVSFYHRGVVNISYYFWFSKWVVPVFSACVSVTVGLRADNPFLSLRPSKFFFHYVFSPLIIH